MAKQHPDARWVTRVIADSFETIQAHARPEYLPAIDHVHPDRTRLTATLRGYGCGTYGCVIATADPGIVLKLTSDETEVEFAREIEPTLVEPVSVEYYLAIRTRHLFQGRPVVLLWREAAADVGRLEEIDPPARELVGKQHRIAQEVYLGFYQGQVPDDMPDQLGEWRRRCEAMRAATSLTWLADGLLRNYDERGVFFGDVHAGNLGRVERGELRWAITDPGHVVVVRAGAPTACPEECGAGADQQQHLGGSAMECGACGVQYERGDPGGKRPPVSNPRGCKCAVIL